MKKKYTTTLHEFVDPSIVAVLAVKAGETLAKKYLPWLSSNKEKSTTTADKLEPKDKNTSNKKSTTTEFPKVFVDFEKQYVNELKNLSLKQLLFYLYLKHNSENKFYNLFKSNRVQFTKQLFSYAKDFSSSSVESPWKTQLSQILNNPKQQDDFIEGMLEYFETLHEDAEDVVSTTKLFEKLKEIK